VGLPFRNTTTFKRVQLKTHPNSLKSVAEVDKTY
jgi:hypothetical protein